MPSTRASSSTRAREYQFYTPGLGGGDFAVQGTGSSDSAVQENGGQPPPPNRLIIAVDFGTTYSAVSYVAVAREESTDLVDPRSIRCIKNYPESWNFNSNDQMHMEVPTEVMYPVNRDFREHEDVNEVNEDRGNRAAEEDDTAFDSNYGINISDAIQQDGDGDIEMSTDQLDAFGWGYRVHELWSLPVTHADNSKQPLSRFKLLLDSDKKTERIREELRPTLQALRRNRIITGPLDVIADFLTCLLRHTKSELQKLNFDDSYSKEIVLCVPAMWTSKACRDMQRCMAVAMARAGIEGVDLQNKSIENLFIVSEPEAAAAYMLTTNAGLMCGDVFVLLDAGGGTVDANTYQISNEAPLRLSREVVVPGGGLYGSSYLNQGFRAHLLSLLADETYLEKEETETINGIDIKKKVETIHGIVEKIMIDHFEYRLKRSFDCYKTTEPKRFPVSGLHNNPGKGFSRGCVVIPANKIKEIFLEHLGGIGSIMEKQINAAMQGGYQVQKILVIGGFASSVSLQKYLRIRLNQFNSSNSCNISMDFPVENTVNAVASGAVLRALNKEQGPRRVARSSYGIMRSEPFGYYKEHEGLSPYYDKYDGLPYIMNTIDWVLKKESLVPPVWECDPFICNHTFKVRPSCPLICREELYVSDDATQSHYRLSHAKNKGAELVGDIVVDFSFLRDEGIITPVEPGVNRHGKKVGVRHYRVEYTMIIRVVDRDLECLAIYDGKIKKKCRINIAAGFRPGVK